MDESELFRLFETARSRTRVFIQPHDFPDHDALAAAYGLFMLLSSEGISSEIVYNGRIGRRELVMLVEKYSIRIKKAEKYHFTEEDGIIIVDGCKGNKNVTNLTGDEIAVIDHHASSYAPGVPFVDIRPGYGSCSSIIREYYEILDKPISKSVASAFLLGLYTDTAFFTRGVHEADIRLLSLCYPLADMDFVTMVLRNKIQYKDIGHYRALLENLNVYDETGYCFLGQGADPNLLGILSDFLLSIQEIKFALVAAKNPDGIYLSVRNEEEQLHAAGVVTQIVAQHGGAGGGHYHMAGGSFPLPADEFDEEEFKDAFFSQIHEWKNTSL